MYRLSVGASQSCKAISSWLGDSEARTLLISRDRLRLDVAIADNREIHAWPDAERFSEDEFRLVLGDGFFGTGDFGFVIPEIFGSSANVDFTGKRVSGGRTLFDYTYAVPVQSSTYQVQTQSAPVISGYSGSFALDPEAEDLAALTLRTAELPLISRVCIVQSRIEYARVNIHERAVLVPRETQLRALYRDGRAGSNDTQYSSCREYGSKATLRFDGVESLSEPSVATPPVQSGERPPSPFPPGLEVRCRIMMPLDSNTAAAGNPISAALLSPIRDNEGVVLAPRGALVQGRLMRFTYHRSKPDFFEVGLRLDSVEVNGSRQPIYAALSHPAAVPLLSAHAKIADGRIPQAADLPSPLPEDVGVFFFVGGSLHLKQLDTVWSTLPPEVLPSTRQPNSPELSPVRQQQAAETDVIKSFALAVNYSQQATALLDAKPATLALADYPRLTDILGLRRQAVGIGKSADTEALNDLYPGLGDRFKNQFLAALTLFIQACDRESGSAGSSRGELSRSTLLYDEWEGWYAIHHDEIHELAKKDGALPDF